MTTEQKAGQLALSLIGEDQNPEPLIEVLIEMAQWQKEQLMKNVTECKVFIPYNAKKYLVIDQNLISNKKLGDKVKVVVIKED